jgi:hypothetical protein
MNFNDVQEITGFQPIHTGVHPNGQGHTTARHNNIWAAIGFTGVWRGRGFSCFYFFSAERHAENLVAHGTETDDYGTGLAGVCVTGVDFLDR